MLAEEGEHLAPAVDRLLHPVARPIDREKGVAGTIVTVEFVVLAEALESGFGLVDLIARGVRIVVAEQPEQRTRHFLGEIDRCDRTLRRNVIRLFGNDASAPAIDSRIDSAKLTGSEIGVPAARAEA